MVTDSGQIVVREQWDHPYTAVFRLVVQKLRRESAHARPFGGDFELRILRMREFSSRFLDNQPENCCSSLFRFHISAANIVQSSVAR